MRSWGWRISLFAAAMMSAGPEAWADCAVCELPAIQDTSFALGNRFLTLMPRQSDTARRGIRGGGFARPPEIKPRPPEEGEPDDWVGDLMIAGQEFSAKGWALWVTGFGSHTARGDSAIAGSVQHAINTIGVASGIDYRISPHLLIGGAMGFGVGRYAADSRASTGSTNSALLGIYGSWSGIANGWQSRYGGLYIDGALNYGHGDIVTRRTIAGGAPEQANASFAAHQLGMRVEVGYRIVATYPVPPVDVTPFGAITVQRLHQGAFVEDARVINSGAPGTQGLSIAGQTTWSARSELGLQFEPDWVVDLFALFTPRLRVAWAHEFNTNRSLTIGSGTALPGIRPGRDALLVSAGLTFQVSGVKGYAQFDGEWSANGTTYGASGGLRVTW